jgi:hypothetical protein
MQRHVSVVGDDRAGIGERDQIVHAVPSETAAGNAGY